MAMQNKKVNVRNPDDTAHRNPPERVEGRDENRDPISGAPGAHPVGVGVGAAAAGAAGAAIGSVVPGVGTAIGGAIGAVVGAIGGGYAGKGIAEAIDPTAEDAYWREELSRRPYYDDRYTFEDDYAPAYGLGYTVRSSVSDRSFDEVEPELRQQWDRVRGKSRLDWDRARGAASDAWQRYDHLQHRRTEEERRNPGQSIR